MGDKYACPTAVSAVCDPGGTSRASSGGEVSSRDGLANYTLDVISHSENVCSCTTNICVHTQRHTYTCVRTHAHTHNAHTHTQRTQHTRPLMHTTHTPTHTHNAHNTHAHSCTHNNNHRLCYFYLLFSFFPFSPQFMINSCARTCSEMTDRLSLVVNCFKARGWCQTL